MAFDPEENEAYDLVELPGHCGTIQKVDCCGVPSVSFVDEKQLRVVALGSGGVAFAWAPTAEVDGLKTRGGLVELALPRNLLRGFCGIAPLVELGRALGAINSTIARVHVSSRLRARQTLAALASDHNFNQHAIAEQRGLTSAPGQV